MSLVGCAFTADVDSSYLKNISLEVMPASYEKKVDEFTKGKATTEVSPYPDDFPPSRLMLYSGKNAVGNGSSGKTFSYFPVAVHLYDLKGVGQNRTISSYVSGLKTALKERRNARALENPYVSLPDFPPRNAGHLVQDDVQYVDFPWGHGVFYLCAFTQGPGNYPGNDELFYLFQGLSNDGRLYVSVDFSVVSDLITRSPEPDPDNHSSRLTDKAVTILEKKLDQEPDDAFSPNLAVIRSVMHTLKIPSGSW